MGFITYVPGDFREYITTTLNTPMVIGKKYYISFWLTNGIANQLYGFSSNNIGLCFSENDISAVGTDLISGVPQIEIEEQVWETNWKQFFFIFEADSAYQHLTIGNFKNSNNTEAIFQVASQYVIAYYFIDKIEVIPIPKLQIIGNENICLGDSATLIGVNDSLYKWYVSADLNTVISNDSSITVSPEVTTTYFLFSNNYSASFTVHVEQPPTLFAGDDITICNSESTQLTAISTSDEPIYWQFGPNNANYLVSPTEDTTYTAFTITQNCSVSDQITVTVLQIENATPIAQLDSIKLTSNFGTSVQLDLTENDIINNFQVWTTLLTEINPGTTTVAPDGWLTYQPIEDFEGQPTIGTYQLCNQTCPTLCSQANIVIDYPRRFLIITPNGDGLNETLNFPNLIDSPANHLIILNRWGSVVFEAKPYTNNWYGQSNQGQILPEATYYYIIKYSIPEADIMTGSVTIKR